MRIWKKILTTRVVLSIRVSKLQLYYSTLGQLRLLLYCTSQRPVLWPPFSRHKHPDLPSAVRGLNNRTSDNLLRFPRAMDALHSIANTRSKNMFTNNAHRSPKRNRLESKYYFLLAPMDNAQWRQRCTQHVIGRRPSNPLRPTGEAASLSNDLVLWT